MIDNVDWILIGNLFFIENCSMGRHRLSCRQGHCPLDAFLDEVRLQSRLGRYGFCYGHRVCGQALLFFEDKQRQCWPKEQVQRKSKCSFWDKLLRNNVESGLAFILILINADWSIGRGRV